MENTNMTSCNHITDEMNVDLNVFCPLMLNRVGRHVTLTLSLVNQGSSRKRICNSRRRLRIHAVFATTLATPQYSASALEREMMCCRLADHDKILSSRNT
nr:hypothetical protein [Tanacetum cinerariifolium]